MKKYELLATVRPNIDLDEADQVISKIEEAVSNFGGNVISTDKMGRKKLAYDVQGFREGYMFSQKMNLPEDKVKDLKRQLRLNDNIIRTMFEAIK